MKVFISYGAAADQVTALRLQALGVANGLTVYVPPAFTRKGASECLDPEVGRILNEAEVILGLVGTGLADACWKELNIGRTLGKNMVVMSHPEFVPALRPLFGPNLVEIDPLNPDKSEIEIVLQLKHIDAQQSARTTLLALGTLVLGLLILAPADPS